VAFELNPQLLKDLVRDVLEKVRAQHTVDLVHKLELVIVKLLQDDLKEQFDEPDPALPQLLESFLHGARQNLNANMVAAYDRSGGLSVLPKTATRFFLKAKTACLKDALTDLRSRYDVDTMKLGSAKKAIETEVLSAAISNVCASFWEDIAKRLDFTARQTYRSICEMPQSKGKTIVWALMRQFAVTVNNSTASAAPTILEFVQGLQQACNDLRKDGEEDQASDRERCKDITTSLQYLHNMTRLDVITAPHGIVKRKNACLPLSCIPKEVRRCNNH